MHGAAAGEKLGTLATAVFSVVTAVNGFATALANPNPTADLLSIAALGMTGNVLGAVITLVGLLSDSGPAVDAQILQQLGALRQQVVGLHNEMKQSFQCIETRLNVIFEVMLTQFAKLEIAIAGNTAALTDVQNALAEQSLRLSNIEATILTAIGEVELHDARVDINRYIGYAETFGQPIPTFGEYTEPENEFQLVATQAAR